MRVRITTVFLVGVLCGAALLGGALFAVQNVGNDVQAQSGNTWQVEYLGDYPAGSVPQMFIESLPAECDLVPDPHDNWLMFYRCPES